MPYGNLVTNKNASLFNQLLLVVISLTRQVYKLFKNLCNMMWIFLKVPSYKNVPTNTKRLVLQMCVQK